MAKELNLKKVFLYASGTIMALGGYQPVQAAESCQLIGDVSNKHSEIPASYTRTLSDSFNLLKEIPLGKQLYNLAKKDNIKICNSDVYAKSINAFAFLKKAEPAYIGYSNNMIERSPASVAVTMAHEFQHYQQHKHANRFLWSKNSDSLQDRLLTGLILEAAARTTSTMVAYQLKQKQPDITLDNRTTQDVKLFSSSIKKYKNLSTKQAELATARYIMQGMLSREDSFIEWRRHYLTAIYNNKRVPQKKIYIDIIEKLENSVDTQYSITGLSKLTELPNGQNIMPLNITTVQILETVKQAATNRVVSINEWERIEREWKEVERKMEEKERKWKEEEKNIYSNEDLWSKVYPPPIKPKNI